MMQMGHFIFSGIISNLGCRETEGEQASTANLPSPSTSYTTATTVQYTAAD